MPENGPIVLVVDNRRVGDPSDRILRIQEIAGDFSPSICVKVARFSDLRESDLPPKTKAIILTGSSYNVSEFQKNGTTTHLETNGGKDFQAEMRMIAEANRPVLAICFGHTLVARAFGGEVRRNSDSSEWNRAMRISTTSGDEFLDGEYVVDVSHRDYVPPDDRNIGKHFVVHATSADERNKRIRYVQYMRHKSLPVYSVQFHPETHDTMPDGYREKEDETFAGAKADGERIIRRFLELAHETSL